MSDTPETTKTATDAMDDKYPQQSFRSKFLSASIGTLITSLIVNPLDVIRVRMQAQEPIIKAANKDHSANAAASNVGKQPFTSTLDALRKIAREEGARTLWRGIIPTLLMAVPSNILYFSTIDFLKEDDRSPIKQYVPDEYTGLVAGAVARTGSTIFVGPLELIRVRMQTTHSSSAAASYRSTMAGISEMVKIHGYHSLWRGMSLTLWRDVPFSCSYWYLIDKVRHALIDTRHGLRKLAMEGDVPIEVLRIRARNQQTSGQALVDSSIAGSIAGAVASVATTPFDVAKTRQQVAAREVIAGVARPEQRAIPVFLWHIWKTEGMSGLYKGWAARVLKVSPACAMMFGAYEGGKKWLN